MAEHPNVAGVGDGDALAKGDFAALTDLLAEDLVWHQGQRDRQAPLVPRGEESAGVLAELMEVTEGSFSTSTSTRSCGG